MAGKKIKTVPKPPPPPKSRKFSDAGEPKKSNRNKN